MIENIAIFVIINKANNEVLKAFHFVGAITHYSNLIWRHGHELKKLSHQLHLKGI